MSETTFVDNDGMRDVLNANFSIVECCQVTDCREHAQHRLAYSGEGLVNYIYTCAHHKTHMTMRYVRMGYRVAEVSHLGRVFKAVSL